MSVTTEQLESPVSTLVSDVIAKQARLLRRFDDVSHYLDGVCAGLYLPGIDQTFDNPVRPIKSTRRPPLLTLEVKENSLVFSGAISRPRNNKLVYSVIFSYDVSLSYTPRGAGKSLPANNLVLARRANELLSALLGYGRRVSFDMHEELQPLKLPTVLREGGNIVAEDYAPVLGFEVYNPASTIETVDIKLPNPAEKILARRGIDYPLSAGQPELEDMVVEFRSMLPDFNIDWRTAVDAILFRRPFVAVNLPRDEALLYSPETVIAAMREAMHKKYRWESSFNDLLNAAKNPKDFVRISRLSALQLFPVETAQDLPADFGGTILTPNNWAPSSSRQAVLQDNA
jgi:hypothetical protein